MGRRRRRVVRIVKKKLPTVFICPRCGEEAVRVTIAKDTGHATVLCALCNLKDDFPAHPAAQPIDVYSYFTDRFYGVKEPRAIIPRDRPLGHAPSEEPIVEEETAAPETPSREMEEPSSMPTVTAGSSSQDDGSSSRVTPESLEAAGENESPEEQTSPVEQSPVESSETPVTEVEKEQEEAEPFADILLENKDKKRYSSQPLPQQSTEQTS
jgi:transcription elongation factor Elf1